MAYQGKKSSDATPPPTPAPGHPDYVGDFGRRLQDTDTSLRYGRNQSSIPSAIGPGKFVRQTGLPSDPPDGDLVLEAVKATGMAHTKNQNFGPYSQNRAVSADPYPSAHGQRPNRKDDAAPTKAGKP
jgi:hypothetical protein